MNSVHLQEVRKTQNLEEDLASYGLLERIKIHSMKQICEKIVHVMM